MIIQKGFPEAIKTGNKNNGEANLGNCTYVIAYVLQNFRIKIDKNLFCDSQGNQRYYSDVEKYPLFQFFSLVLVFDLFLIHFVKSLVLRIKLLLSHHEHDHRPFVNLRNRCYSDLGFINEY